MFTPKKTWALLIPLIIEQMLNSLMGTADSMMVSTVSSAVGVALAATGGGDGSNTGTTTTTTTSTQ